MQVISGNIDRVTKDDLNVLLETSEETVVSIRMPVKRVEAEVGQNPIRLHNLLREAEQKLCDSGMETVKAHDMLMPAYELLEEDKSFWLHQHDGLVLYLGPDRFLFYRLPISFNQKVVTGRWFCVRPLLRFLQYTEPFFILTLSQGGIAFFEATRHSMHEVDLAGVPENLETMLQYEVTERHVQFHTGATRRVTGKRSAIFHGQGGGSDDTAAKTNILHYFQKVDNAVCDVLTGQQAPLIVVGIEFLQGLYREANHYKYLVPRGVDTNPEQLSKKQLHNRTRTIAEPLLKASLHEAVNKYHHLAGSNAASHDLCTVVRAAYQQRVHTLFVPCDLSSPGVFEPHQDRIEQHEERKSGDVDLIDEAVAYSLINGGKVYVMERDHMPAEPVAAVFRY